jgi:hypothetical protein
MFRATILSIFRSFRQCSTACGMLYPIRCRSVIWYRRTPLPDHRPATYWVQHTTSCTAQPKAPEDGQNCWPKHVELNWIYQQTIIVAYSWLSSLPPLLTMHGQTNIKFVKMTVFWDVTSWRLVYRYHCLGRKLCLPEDVSSMFLRNAVTLRDIAFQKYSSS